MMNDRPDNRQPDSHAGLCARCTHARVVVSDRGSRFVLCARSANDPDFPKYPPLPVTSCRGYEPPHGGDRAPGGQPGT